MIKYTRHIFTSKKGGKYEIKMGFTYYFHHPLCALGPHDWWSNGCYKSVAYPCHFVWDLPYTSDQIQELFLWIFCGNLRYDDFVDILKQEPLLGFFFY